MRPSKFWRYPKNPLYPTKAKRNISFNYVNKKLEKHDQLEQLIGENPLAVMYNNNFNHIDFMINVLKLNNFEMLVRMLFWVYKTYHAHGFHYDYFLFALNTWKEAVKTYLDEKEAKEINTIYD